MLRIWLGPQLWSVGPSNPSPCPNSKPNLNSDLDLDPDPDPDPDLDPDPALGDWKHGAVCSSGIDGTCMELQFCPANLKLNGVV